MENLLSYLQHAETKSVRKSLTSSIPFRKLLEDFISKIMSRSCKGLKCSLHKAKTKPCSYTLYEESCFYLTKGWLAVLRVELDWRSPSSLQSCPFHHSPCFRRLTESGTSPLHQHHHSQNHLSNSPCPAATTSLHKGNLCIIFGASRERLLKPDLWFS